MNPNLKVRFSDASGKGTTKFRTSLEFVFNQFPDYNTFSVVCEVFQFALQVKGSENKYVGEVMVVAKSVEKDFAFANKCEGDDECGAEK